MPRSKPHSEPLRPCGRNYLLPAHATPVTQILGGKEPQPRGENCDVVLFPPEMRDPEHEAPIAKANLARTPAMVKVAQRVFSVHLTATMASVPWLCGSTAWGLRTRCSHSRWIDARPKKKAA
jgi:hypothetical protein